VSAFRNPFRRRRPAPAPRPGPLSIAVLEYELYGTEPEPGTMAAAYLNLRANTGNPIPRGGQDHS
jgi:hypothetical protein